MANVNNNIKGFELSTKGYVELAYVDLYSSNESTDSVSSGISVTVDEKPSNKKNDIFNFHCDISMDIDFSMSLPFYFGKPTPNLTLFKKADEFSLEISKLNDILINLFQEMGCCGISDEYNKTVVPIFRYLASTKEHDECNGNGAKSPNLDEHECGGNSNFMKEILRVVKDLTKVYTAIEPIFCLISPIPGNPWLPIDFNWMAPILPYLQAFNQVMDKIMSGYLFDIIIDPLKDLNNSLINCSRPENSRSITRRRSTAINKSNNKLIATMEEQKIADMLKTKNKENETSNALTKVKSVTRELANKETNEKLEQELITQKDIKGLYNLSDREASLLAETRNGGKGICKCLLDMTGMSIPLPKFPKAEIRILPTTSREINNIYSNDLLKYTNETAFSIKQKDMYSTSKSDSNITFSKSLVTDQDFINKFRAFIDKDGGTLNYVNNVLTSLANSDIDPKRLLDEDGFKDKLKANKEALIGTNLNPQYSDSSEYIKKTIGDYNLFIPTEVFGKPSEILNENRKIRDEVSYIHSTETNYILKLNEIKKQELKLFNEYKILANKELKKVKSELKKRGIVKIWYEKNRSLLEAQNLYLAVFGAHYEFDINRDFDNTRVQEKYMAYKINYQETDGINDNYDFVIKLDKLAKEYIEKRSELFTSKNKVDNSSMIDQIKTAQDKLKDIINEFGLTYPVGTSEKDKLNKLNTFKESSRYVQYRNKLTVFYHIPFNESVFNSLKKSLSSLVKDDLLIIRENEMDFIFDDTRNTLESTSSTTTGKEKGFIYYSIKILQCEEYKKTLLKVVEDNIAYKFFCTYYMDIDCTCESIICKLLKMIVQYLLVYINKFISYIIQLLIEYLIPKWLRALIDLILYKLKCIFKIIYMKDQMTLIDDTYESVLNNMKTRVANYPYDGCVNEQLDSLLKQIKDTKEDEAGTDPDEVGNSTNLDDDLKTLYGHEVQVAFYLNGKEVFECSKEDVKNIYIQVVFDIGASISSVVLSDALAYGSEEELIGQSNTDKTTITIPTINVDKITSGSIKVKATSNKPIADTKILTDNATLKIIDFNNASGGMYLKVIDYKTNNNIIFLEENKDTLYLIFNIILSDDIGDPKDNLHLISSYIEKIMIFSSSAVSDDLPVSILNTSDIQDDVHYLETTNEYALIVNASKFFKPASELICEIYTHPVYSGNFISATNDILCNETDNIIDTIRTDLIPSTEFTDTIIPSNYVDKPLTAVSVPGVSDTPIIHGTDESDLESAKMHVNRNDILKFDCSKTTVFGNTGTSAKLNEVLRDYGDMWETLGLLE